MGKKEQAIQAQTLQYNRIRKALRKISGWSKGMFNYLISKGYWTDDLGDMAKSLENIMDGRDMKFIKESAMDRNQHNQKTNAVIEKYYKAPVNEETIKSFARDLYEQLSLAFHFDEGFEAYSGADGQPSFTQPQIEALNHILDNMWSYCDNKQMDIHELVAPIQEEFWRNNLGIHFGGSVEAYDKGKEAYSHGADVSQNPYPKEEKGKHESWIEGWTDAQGEDNSEEIMNKHELNEEEDDNPMPLDLTNHSLDELHQALLLRAKNGKGNNDAEYVQLQREIQRRNSAEKEVKQLNEYEEGADSAASEYEEVQDKKLDKLLSSLPDSRDQIKIGDTAYGLWFNDPTWYKFKVIEVSDAPYEDESGLGFYDEDSVYDTGLAYHVVAEEQLKQALNKIKTRAKQRSGKKVVGEAISKNKQNDVAPIIQGMVNLYAVMNSISEAFHAQDDYGITLEDYIDQNYPFNDAIFSTVEDMEPWVKNAMQVSGVRLKPTVNLNYGEVEGKKTFVASFIKDLNTLEKIWMELSRMMQTNDSDIHDMFASYYPFGTEFDELMHNVMNWVKTVKSNLAVLLK